MNMEVLMSRFLKVLIILLLILLIEGILIYEGFVRSKNKGIDINPYSATHLARKVPPTWHLAFCINQMPHATWVALYYFIKFSYCSIKIFNV